MYRLTECGWIERRNTHGNHRFFQPVHIHLGHILPKKFTSMVER